MKFYGNILASTYNFYGRFIYTSVCEMLFVFFCFAILKSTTNYDFFKIAFPNKALSIVLIGILMVGNFIFYSKKRVSKIVEKYNRKSKMEKTLWGIIAIINFVLPLLVFPILFTQH